MVEAGAEQFVGGDLVDDDVGLLLEVFEQVARGRLVEWLAGGVDQRGDDLALLFGRGCGAVALDDGGLLPVRVDGIQQVAGQRARGLAAGGLRDAGAVFVGELAVECGQTRGQR